MDDQRVAEDVELGSLARDSEKIRLKQADERANALAPLRQGTSVAGAAATAKLKSDGKSSGPKYGQMPGGIWFVFALLAICSLSGAVQFQRCVALSIVAKVFERSIGSEVYILTQEDLALALKSNGDHTGAEVTLDSLVKTLTARYGERDQRVAFAKLELASLYIDTKREELARGIWTQQLKLLDKPEAEAPKALTEVLQKLATQYDDDLNNKEAARMLYLATLRFWPHAAGNGTISNVEADLAEIDERMGNYPEANEYFRKAFEYSQRFGKAHYNVYRLWQVGYTYDKMGMYTEAVPYLEKALDMSNEIGWLKGSELGDLSGELQIAKAGQSGQTEGMPDYGVPGRVFSDVKYKLSQDVYHLWMTGYDFIKIRKYKEAQLYLEKAVKMAKQVGWPTGSELTDLRETLDRAKAGETSQNNANK